MASECKLKCFICEVEKSADLSPTTHPFILRICGEIDASRYKIAWPKTREFGRFVPVLRFLFEVTKCPTDLLLTNPTLAPSSENKT